MATKLASGYIELTVKSNVKKDVSDQLSDVEKQAKKTGDAIDKSLGKGAERAAKSTKDLGKELDSAKGKAKQTGDELEKSVTRGAKNAGKSVENEIGGAGKRASKSIGEDILDGALKASRDGGKALSDALVNAAGEGGKAIGKAIGDTAVGDWLRDIQEKAEPVLDVTHKIGDAFYAFKNKDIAGGLSSVADGLTKIGQSDAGKTLGDIARQAQPLQDTFFGLKDSISGTTEGLLTLAGNSGKIAGGLSAISAAAGPLAIVAALLPKMPGFMDSAGGVLDQIKGKKGFNARDWFQTANPALGALSEAMGWGSSAEHAGSGPFGGTDPTKGFQSPIPAKPGVSAIPLPGSAPAVEPGYQASTGSSDPFAALGGPGGAKAAPSGMTGPKGAVFNAMVNAGFAPSEFGAVDSIVSRESSWNPGATNPSSGAYGLFQFLGHQGDKYGALGGYSADPGQQAAAGMAYIKDRYGTPSNAKAFWDSHGWYDDGGLLQPGITIAHNETGKPELVLTEDQLKGAQPAPQGIDMGALLGDGQADNPAAPSAPGKPGGKDLRTQGYIPAGAGGSGAAGSSFISGSLQMGAQAINGLIDQAASAASQAASMGANAFAPGSGGAAGAAASTAIGIGTQAAKRGVQYGFQLAGIAGDAATEILMPFGVPRFFQTDPSQFMPQLPGKAAAITTGEKAQQQGNPGLPNEPGNQPGGPVQPGQLPGAQAVGSPAPIASPGTGDFKPNPIKVPGLGGTPTQAGSNPAPPAENAGPMPKAPAPAIAAPTPPAPAQQQPPKPPGPLDFLPMDTMVPTFDSGGWLMPGEIGINKSNAPEPMAVFTPEQWGTLGGLAKGASLKPDPSQGGNGSDYSIHFHDTVVKDVNEMINQANAQQRLQRMRYGGRP
ncbi:transglycosylase SLT domain-containing protein [Mycobacterium sp. 3-98]|uniref:aggregation-promoting factor C-terminal-like domain-containing protein n=1 Tax=Mycobacterium sp. 3-98 TaxID=3042317 RepID=UPI002DDBD258|nr:transglycosylase SLT domain-containing protein [Mycobacterium sp. 3-98]WSE45581.1 transglycosylase SLT domain-containing protein [Mycobacterium sp. 3-98]